MLSITLIFQSYQTQIGHIDNLSPSYTKWGIVENCGVLRDFIWGHFMHERDYKPLERSVLTQWGL